MKKFNEKQILNLIISKFGNNNMEPYMGKDDISIIPLDSLNSSSNEFNDNKFLAVTCDMLVEHTDVPPKMTFEQIARKSVVSSVSDLVSKGIIPKAALISLGLPKSLKNSEIIIDCCMFGSLSSVANMPRRNGACIGDYVVVSGIFGYSSSGLKILMNNLSSPDSYFRKRSIDSVLKPSPSYEFGIFIAHYFSSSMDSSDGLASSLHELSKQSGVNLLIEKDKIPIPPKLTEFLSINNLDFHDLVFYGGEEYHIVGTISEKNLLEISKILKMHHLKLYIIGKVVSGNGRVFVLTPNRNKKLLKNKGYSHFT
jgi:thiamine-monophosphate kinase